MREEKRRSKSGGWKAVAQGSILLLGIYMIAMLFLALLITKGTVKETVGALPMYMVAMVAAWCGGKWVLKTMGAKMNLYAIVPAVLFCLVYIVFGVWMCDGDIQLQQAIGLILCVLFGGAASIMTTRHKKRKGKRVRKR